jgi:hypothetical protein
VLRSASPRRMNTSAIFSGFALSVPSTRESFLGETRAAVLLRGLDVVRVSGEIDPETQAVGEWRRSEVCVVAEHLPQRCDRVVPRVPVLLPLEPLYRAWQMTGRMASWCVLYTCTVIPGLWSGTGSDPSSDNGRAGLVMPSCRPQWRPPGLSVAGTNSSKDSQSTMVRHAASMCM